MLGNVHQNPGPATKYPCPVCARNVTSRGVSYQCNICSGWVHAKCSGVLNAAQYRRSSDWACDPCSTSPPTPSPLTTPTPPTEGSNDSRLHVVEPPRERSFIWQIGVVVVIDLPLLRVAVEGSDNPVSLEKPCHASLPPDQQGRHSLGRHPEVQYPGLDSMSPARSRRSASHAAGTHGWLPQKTGRPGLRRGGVGGYNLHSVPPNSPPDCGTVAHQPRAGCIRLVRQIGVNSSIQDRRQERFLWSRVSCARQC